MYGQRAVDEIQAQGWKLAEHDEEQDVHRAVLTHGRKAVLVISWSRIDKRFTTPVITIAQGDDTRNLPAKAEKTLRTTAAPAALKALMTPAQASTKAMPAPVSEAGGDALTVA